MKLLQMLPLMRIRRTLRKHSLLVEAFTDSDNLDVAKTSLNEMRSDWTLKHSPTMQCHYLLLLLLEVSKDRLIS
ncbi:hypothetical protein MIMGU_mgv11b024360mg [Erythranthe guttata]|uniref:Uncharacterized protein n=1 Tax=Erythranthe guttata TaxID=4155 RepID=A0A022R7V5_ERYGU|nr:hypothetical protein MIMGU_mgv11b024360mg [Erythranthe guttata]